MWIGVALKILCVIHTMTVDNIICCETADERSVEDAIIARSLVMDFPRNNTESVENVYEVTEKEEQLCG